MFNIIIPFRDPASKLVAVFSSPEYPVTQTEIYSAHSAISGNQIFAYPFKKRTLHTLQEQKMDLFHQNGSLAAREVKKQTVFMAVIGSLCGMGSTVNRLVEVETS
jgi:hypothetical protein